MNVLNVEIGGENLVHERTLKIVEEILTNVATRKLNKISFMTTGAKKGALGEYFPRTGIAVVSLKEVLEKSLEKAKEANDDAQNVLGLCWMNVIWTLGHEIHHAEYQQVGEDILKGKEEMMAAGMDMEDEMDEDELFGKDAMAEEEKDADEFGDEMVKHIAKYRAELIEPPPIESIPYFGENILKAVVEGKEKDEAWALMQHDMLTNGIMYSAANFDVESLREYIRVANDGGADWEEVSVPVEKEKVIEAAVGKVMNEMTTSVDATAPTTETIAEVAQETQTSMMDMLDYIPDPGDEGTGEVLTEFDNVEAAIGASTTMEDLFKLMQSQLMKDPQDSTTASPEPALATNDAGPIGLQPLQKEEQAPTSSISEGVKQAVVNIYLRIFNHVFGKVFRTGGSWIDRAELYRPINVKDLEIPGVKILAYATDMNARLQTLPANGEIVGRTFKDGALPGYDIQINLGNNITLKRRLIVQNPVKQKTEGGEFTPWAIRAQNGEKIMCVFDAAVQRKWAGTIQNGVWKPQENR